jgi:RHS repeat-associated protein
LLLDTSGAAAQWYVFDAYGTIIASNAAPLTPILYAGEYFDGNLWTYNNRSRWLNQGTGRFLTMDTDEGDPEEPLRLHKYLYCRANPVNSTDPTGHGEFDVVMDIEFSWMNGVTRIPTASWVPGGFKGMNSAEASEVAEARDKAEEYADDAVQLMQSVNLQNVPARFVHWFGAADQGRIDKVKATWNKIDNAFHSTTLMFEAHKPWYGYGNHMDYYGDTHPFYEAIRLGDDFWSAPLTGEDSKAGTIVHEVSHKFAGTGDKYYHSDDRYSIADAENLARFKPGKAVKNANNYEYFVEHAQ